MTRQFSRWLSKTDLSTEVEMERGLIDANLGGGIIRKRVGVGLGGGSGLNE